MIVHQRLRRLRHVSKPSTSNENIPNAKAPPSSKEAVVEAAKPNVPLEVPMNDSSGSTNEYGYFKDDIDLGKLQSSMKELMDENKILELNTNCVTDDVVDKTQTILKWRMWVCHLEYQEVASRRDLEDDLDRYDGYEAQVYDLTEQEQEFCDQYDICLNSRCRK
ncbi:hypothetical protein Tco_0361120 [Tanacetum coccineum]